MSLEYKIVGNNESSYGHEIDHMMINKFLTGQPICHEWIFINYLYKDELRKNPDIALMFLMFAMQFYPDYEWVNIDLDDPIASLVLECFLTDKTFEDIGFVDVDKQRAKALQFGSIVTDFAIRVLGYSLIGVQKQKIIVTARSDCDKRFADLLYDGYALQRLARLGYKKLDAVLKYLYPEVDGYFYRLPVLPTKDIGIEIEELIETDDMKFVRVK